MRTKKIKIEILYKIIRKIPLKKPEEFRVNLSIYTIKKAIIRFDQKMYWN